MASSFHQNFLDEPAPSNTRTIEASELDLHPRTDLTALNTLEHQQQCGIDELDEELSDASLQSTRQNKYIGPPSTWRAWTRHERHIAEALDSDRSRDLSLHLYNAFSITKKATMKPSPCENDDAGAVDSVASQKFTPSRTWTAWPMTPDIVPREDGISLNDHDEKWTIRGPVDERPSADLEECLISYMMKTAKERFRAREWDYEIPKDTRRSSSVFSQATSQISSATESEEAGDGLQPRIKLHPTIQVDDEKSSKLLRPASRFILTNLDGLLFNLHQARSVYVKFQEGILEDLETGTEGFPLQQGSRHSQSGNRQREKSAAKLARAGYTASGGSTSGQRSGAHRQSHSKFGETRQARLGLRDWSDILGTASIMSWPKNALNRTASRCSALFGEEMTFRTLNEGQLRLEKTDRGHTWEYMEDSVLEEGERPRKKRRKDAKPIPPSFVSQYKKHSIFCPVNGCSRQTKGFSRTWNLNQHLKTKHSDSRIELV